MAATLTNVILTFLHIFFSVGWLGASLFFTVVIGPLLMKLSAPTRGELMTKLVPRLVRYVNIFSGLTLLLGVFLAFGIVGSRLELLSPANPWALNITTGATLGLLAALIGSLVVGRTARRMSRMVERLMQNPAQPPPPEMAGLQNRLRTWSTVALVLLVLSLVFMTTAGRFPLL